MRPKGLSRGPGPPNGARVEWVVAQSARPFVRAREKIVQSCCGGRREFQRRRSPSQRRCGGSAGLPGDWPRRFVAEPRRLSVAQRAIDGARRLGRPFSPRLSELARKQQFDNRPAPLISSPRRAGSDPGSACLAGVGSPPKPLESFSAPRAPPPRRSAVASRSSVGGGEIGKVFCSSPLLGRSRGDRRQRDQTVVRCAALGEIRRPENLRQRSDGRHAGPCGEDGWALWP